MRRFNGVRSVMTLALGTAAVLCSANARAADFAQDAYTAPAAPADLLWVERAAPVTESGPSVKPFLRLTLGYADDPLVLRNEDGAERVLIDSELGGYLSGGITLWRRFQVALLVPAYLRSQGNVGGYDLDGVIAGDPGVDLRLTLLDRTSPVELAIAGTIRAPFGGEGAFASDGSVSAWPRAILSVPFGARSFVSLGAGPVIRPSANEQSLDVSDALKLAGGVHLGLTDHWGLTGEVAGSTPFSDPFADGRTPLELAAGVRFQGGPWVAALGGGPGLTNGFGTPDFRLLASLGAQFGDDAPPPAPEPVDTDPDRDGVHGAADQCPNEPEDKDGFQDEDGCPDLDNDGDGVPDTTDKCPNEAEDKDGFQDEDGCPDLDNDGDGIADADDKCPDEAEDKDGWQDEDGCPDPDNDGDGIADADDKCPNEAETVNGIDDDDGCPDLIRVESGQIRTLEPIFFEYNRAKIQPRSEPMLMEMATLIKSRADLGRISIEGHTDDRGAAAYNLKLSQERAEAVRSFLIAAGVEAERLEAHGFGKTRPIDDNKTEAGRARNRRVDFRLVDLVGAAEAESP